MARRGLKPGQKHSGSFRPGYDPRRAVEPVLDYRGHSLLMLARQHTEKAVEVLAECLSDESAPWSHRTAASTAILDRGWGRPANVLDVVMNERPSDLPALSTRDLEAIAQGAAFDGEYEVIESGHDLKKAGVEES